MGACCRWARVLGLLWGRVWVALVELGLRNWACGIGLAELGLRTVVEGVLWYLGQGVLSEDRLRLLVKGLPWEIGRGVL